MSQIAEVQKEGVKDDVLQWVTFQLEDETYGINVMQVREVLRYTEIAPVPARRITSLALSTCVVMSLPLSTHARALASFLARSVITPVLLSSKRKLRLWVSLSTVLRKWFTSRALKSTLRRAWVLMRVPSLSRASATVMVSC